MQPYPPPPSRPNPAPWIALAAVGVVAAGLLGFAVGRSSASAGSVVTKTVTAVATETARRTAAPTTEAASASSGIQPGAHVVGRDIQPGDYRTEGPAGSTACYWARLSDTTGAIESVLANGNIRGATTVTILATDGAFETTRCKEWVKVG
jgi:hypothetical protein